MNRRPIWTCFVTLTVSRQRAFCCYLNKYSHVYSDVTDTMNRTLHITVAVLLFVILLTNHVTGYVIQPSEAKSSDQSAMVSTFENNATEARKVSDDYSKYSFIITTYL